MPIYGSKQATNNYVYVYVCGEGGREGGAFGFAVGMMQPCISSISGMGFRGAVVVAGFLPTQTLLTGMLWNCHWTTA